ncbi:MAG TPA: hypothetical protein VEW04_06810 [Allosphingosinicella sp.]|nr:hypothetical protein [Allosphingosinicella sp.]
MAVAFWLAFQAAPAPAAQSAPAPIAFDLATVERARYDPSDPITLRPCDRGVGDAIVVCGRRAAGAYPMAEWERVFPPQGPLRAETSIGGGALASIDAETVVLDRGAVTNRIMVTFRIPF